MAWIAAVGSVGAGPSEGQLQIQQRAQAPREPRPQQQLEDIGRQALRLIERAMKDAGTPGQALDVLA